MRRIHVQVAILGHVQTVSRPQECFVAIQQLGRHKSFVQQTLRTIQVGQNLVQ